MFRSRSLAGLASLVLASAAFSQALPGFDVRTLPIRTSGGFDLTPEGHALLFDGTSVLEVDRSTGRVLATLFTPPTAVFGSFVRFDPVRAVTYFGESSTGAVYELSPGHAARQLTTLAFNFDCAIAPDGLVVLSADPTFSGTNTLYALDPTTGGLDPLVRVPGASGPVVFDDHGNLVTVTQSAQFPPPPGASFVLRFDGHLLRSAAGPGELDPSAAQVLARGLDGGFRARFSGDGALFVAEGHRVHRVDPSGSHAPFFEDVPGVFLSYLAFEPGRTTPFRAYAPSSGGRLFVSASDFVAREAIYELEPRRPELNQRPANPIPEGPVTYALASGPPSATLVPLVSSHRAPHEVLWNLPEPTFLALSPHDVLILPAVALDAHGIGMISLTTAGNHASGLVLHWQGLVLDGSPSIVGSSNPLTAVLQ